MQEVKTRVNGEIYPSMHALRKSRRSLKMDDQGIIKILVQLCVYVLAIDQFISPIISHIDYVEVRNITFLYSIFHKSIYVICKK